MKQIKIKAFNKIKHRRQCKIVNKYINQHNNNGIPISTKKNTNNKVTIDIFQYRVSCHETKTMFVFSIRWDGFKEA